MKTFLVTGGRGFIGSYFVQLCLKNGHKVIYGKIGREESTDVQIVKKVREAVGKDIRLRFDPNEAWDLVTAKRMIEKLEDVPQTGHVREE